MQSLCFWPPESEAGCLSKNPLKLNFSSKPPHFVASLFDTSSSVLILSVKS